MAVSILDIVTDAFTELGVRGAADTLSADDGELGLNKFIQLLDEWNADPQTVYRVTFSSFTLTANLSPHTIGASGATFTVTQRPEAIEAANIIDTAASPDVTLQTLALRSKDWYEMQRVQALTSKIPTSLYYDPAWPNGNLYFWPIPTVAYQVQLWMRLHLASAIVLTDTFTMPPGYRKALMLTLAEDLAAPLAVQVKPSTSEAARKARARVFANNTAIPRLITQNAGMPRGGKAGSFNYLNGSVQ